MPRPGQAVAEGVDCPLRVRREARAGHEVDPRGSEGEEGVARPDHAHPHGPCGVVPGAAGDPHAAAEAELVRHRVAELARCLRALHETRHRGQSETRRGEHLRRPAPRSDVQPQGAGGVGHLRDRLPGEAKAQEILRQQDACHAREERRLLLRHPEQLRRREAGHGAVAGDGARPRLPLLQHGALRRAAAVVPQDGGPQRLAGGIEQGRAVHLARKPHGPHRLQLGPVARAERPYGFACRLPPVLRVLLRPAGMRARDAERAL